MCISRATLRRGFAFNQSIKNPPLVKTRNIQSQSFNYPQQSSQLQQIQYTPGYTTTSHLLSQQLQQQPHSILSGGTTTVPPPVVGRTSGQSTPKISRSSSSNETNDAT